MIRRRVANRRRPRPRLLRVGATAKGLERSPRHQCGTFDRSDPRREDPRQGGIAATTNRHHRPRLRRHRRVVRDQAVRHPRQNRDDKGHPRMAKKVTVELVDDITDEPGARTIHFGLDGVDYEIDLIDDRPLREALKPYMRRGRRVGGSAKERATPRGRSDSTLIRQWARDHGHEVPERGRLPKATIRAYDEFRRQARDIE
ncbi:hypothetical protein MSZK_28200 [Mycobacterium sp. shizuoka-1]|nr:hypothetical protein MSZK_28200 [Mycobacterium sp. shizuoka-1]